MLFVAEREIESSRSPSIKQQQCRGRQSGLEEPAEQCRTLRRKKAIQEPRKRPPEQRKTRGLLYGSLYFQFEEEKLKPVNKFVKSAKSEFFVRELRSPRNSINESVCIILVWVHWKNIPSEQCQCSESNTKENSPRLAEKEGKSAFL